MTNAYREAVEETHGGTATYRGTVRVVDRGKTAWDGHVHVFGLEGNALATEAYAWKVKTGIVAVLKTPPVDGPLSAVRAAIASGDA